MSSSPKTIRLGVLVPSSNTALEPLTQSIISTIPNVTVHFSRFRVTQISLSSDALSQFDQKNLVEAAKLLADADVDAIGWSGTSAGWLGFEADEQLCAAIIAATGKPATTSVLALNKALELFGVTKLGLVTPYLPDVQAKIVENYGSIGVDAGAERHLSRSDNVRFAQIDEKTLDPMVAEVVREGVQAVTTFCTNLSAAQHAARWEKEHGVPVFDTVTTVVWDLLRLCGVNTKGVVGWGRLISAV
ncbi:putative Asp/Glu racemase [Macrophomina phaseolina]|uniref:Asp/Glu racemase n=1 Tax=Macrophomina phaseolina TaxID=35725 RepID=A0ABQ8FY50_9PEZI|nr:putative Asp/Glu racemase [Macrophomina phaseolina]